MEEKMEEKGESETGVIGRCKALYPFPGEGPDDLSFQFCFFLFFLFYFFYCFWLLVVLLVLLLELFLLFFSLLFPFYPSSLSHLPPSRSGDILNILDKDDPSGWWKGTLNGKVGMIPTNFVELLE